MERGHQPWWWIRMAWDFQPYRGQGQTRWAFRVLGSGGTEIGARGQHIR